MTETLTHLIGGKAVSAVAERESLNPSDTREVVALAPDGGEAEVDAAVAAARAAFPAWAGASPEVRSDLLDRVGELILARRADLGRLLSREEGKTLPEGVGEVARAGRIFKYFAGEALRRHGQFLDSTRPGVEVTTAREPVGVFGLITPWNFPIAIPAWKAAPALAFGDTVVMKPAETTPAMARALAALIQEAGAPAGVFNLVLGAGAAGAAIANHPGIDGVSFTGSQATGAKVGMAAMARQARVQMEMGGKNPLVVLDDADLDRAVACALDGAFFQTGQRCTASSRIIVTEGVHDRFVEALVAKVAALKVGDALDPATQMGPAASERQFEQNLSYVDIAVKEGGRLAFGGERLKLDKPGYYMSPAVITGTDPAMRINREEVFGPVASLVRVKDYEAALEVANAGGFGLSAGIVTTSLKHATHFRRAVRAGMVMVNLPTAGVDYHVPFGGVRGSSYGAREQGFAAIEFYTQTKTAYCLA
ncbi:aldehyde dehydrogenase family protein [Phenylobacterium montanum]|uniref:Aldehyde dehydrogenase family protein n=1 Tax=Phenylobacterium montanum TaxID=2823693 RepID=A0A975IUS2_9CAUL|nr:aldehyde dehydrogenase family protein [Caulobacter sp. S6]QUD88262.1 aldehyde dehydrogenase family protein [Caulobacter sp. S6]